MTVRAMARAAYTPAKVDAEAFFEAQGTPYGPEFRRGKFDTVLFTAGGAGSYSTLIQSASQAIVLLNEKAETKSITRDIALTPSLKIKGKGAWPQ